MKSEVASASRRPRPRIGLAMMLLVAGLVWSVMFQKKVSLAPDMVASVCIGVGMIGSGLIVATAERMSRTALILSLALRGSLLANASAGVRAECVRLMQRVRRPGQSPLIAFTAPRDSSRAA